MSLSKSKKLYGADPEVLYLAKVLDLDAPVKYDIAGLLSVSSGSVVAKSGLKASDVLGLFGENSGDHFSGKIVVGTGDTAIPAKVKDGYIYVAKSGNNVHEYVKFTIYYGGNCKHVLLNTSSAVAQSTSVTVKLADYSSLFSE